MFIQFTRSTLIPKIDWNISTDVAWRNNLGCGVAQLGCDVAQRRVKRSSVRVRRSSVKVRRSSVRVRRNSMVSAPGYCKAGFESWPGTPW